MRRKHAQGHRDHRPDCDAELESGAGDAPVRAQEHARLNSPLRVVITHFRKRLCDYDRLCANAAMDAIRRTGLFADDSPKHIAEVRNIQIKSAVEKTVFRFEELPQS